MNKIKYQYFLCIILLCLQGFASAQAGKRIALVIGNSQYQALNRLPNPKNDAQAVAEKLSGLGFQLLASNGRFGSSPVLDLNENNFLKMIKKFSQQAQGAEIALIYYAGHGMQFGTGSYLLPVDVPKDDIDLLQRHAISLDSILTSLDNKAQLAVAVFDACREIPELETLISDATRSTGLGVNSYRGLGRVQSRGRSRVVAFSGAAGQLVKDGTGKHSPYTRELLTQLDTQGQEVGDVFRQVAYRFGQQHEGQQPEVLIQGVPPQQYYFTVKPYQSRESIDSRYPLYIKTTPAAARVRILDIGPKYQPGMLLTPRKYKVEVSYPGYLTDISQFALDQDHQVYYVALQQASVTSPKPPKPDPVSSLSDPYTGMKFVRVKAGNFQMGSDEYSDEKPVHRVYLSHDYLLGQYEVTQGQWKKVMGNNPSYFTSCGDNCPVEQVSWEDIQQFIKKLNQQTGLHYRLPTEAEWEYACRGGQQHQYCGSDNAERVGWYNENAEGKTHPVGQKVKNAYGLYDMSGNVWEWVQDWYAKDYYANSPSRDPKGPNSGRWRVSRGGGWSGSAHYLRSAYRDSLSPGDRDHYMGFRLARQP